MQPEDHQRNRPEPGSAADWMRHARSDLALAGVTAPPEVLTETLCFHAQQAAEKGLKAVLVAHGHPAPRIHNIRTLIELLPARLAPPPLLNEAAALSVYAVLTRYPADVEPITEEEYQEAIALAEAVVEWAEQHV